MSDNIDDTYYEAEFDPVRRIWNVIRYSADIPDGEKTGECYGNEKDAHDRAERLNGVEEFGEWLDSDNV